MGVILRPGRGKAYLDAPLVVTPDLIFGRADHDGRLKMRTRHDRAWWDDANAEAHAGEARPVARRLMVVAGETGRLVAHPAISLEQPCDARVQIDGGDCFGP